MSYSIFDFIAQLSVTALIGVIALFILQLLLIWLFIRSAIESGVKHALIEYDKYKKRENIN